MEKIKGLNFGGLLKILKACLIAVIITLVGIVLLAVVLKFVDLSSRAISYINDIIKAFAIFIMMLCVKKQGEEKLLIKSIFAGIIYAILTFVIFSILNGNFNFNMAFVYDLLFSLIVAVIITIIIKILKRKTI